MSGMSGGSMLRARRKDVNVKPNRKLDRKSSRGMLYENEELRLRTININAEVERGQTDIKKLKRENEQLRREISALRYEYERLDTMLRERSSSPLHSDDSGRSCCSACQECEVDEAKAECKEQPPAGLHVAFHDLSVVPEEEPQVDIVAKSPDGDCSCEACRDNQANKNDEPSNANQQSESIREPLYNQQKPPREPPPSQPQGISMEQRTVDVLLHDTPTSYLVTSVASPPPPGFHPPPPPPPPGFSVPYDTQPRFHTGGNIEDLLGEVEMGPNVISTEFIQQNSVFMCNTRKIIHRREPCKCQKQEKPQEKEQPKCYVTEKNIDLNYDYPRTAPIPQQNSPDHLQHTPEHLPADGVQTTEEVASTFVVLERRYPVKPKGKFDFFFRSRSAPVGENEEPIYATVNKLPKRLRRMELVNLEKEVAYRNGDTARETSQTDRTDTEESLATAEEDISETEKSPPVQRPDTPKAKKRRRFSFTFKKRGERKKKLDKKKVEKEKPPIVNESDSERLIGARVEQGATSGPCASPRNPRKCRHMRTRTIASSVSSGPRYKRDSYQEMTSHSEHERTNSISSSISSLATHKSRKLSTAPADTSIPWCGCWGAGCL